MKVEKISESKAVIVLTKSDLKKRKITINDLKEGKSKAQDFFFEVLEEVNIIDSFNYEESQLFVEVAITPDDTFVITITKTESIPDIALNSESCNTNIIYTISSTLYEFDCLKDLYDFITIANSSCLYTGINSLYEFNGNYFLLFSKPTIKKSKFLKTYFALCEFSKKCYSKQESNFLEYAKEIIANTATQSLSKI